MSTASHSILYVWDADYPWDVRTEKVTLALTRAGHDVTIVARNRAWAAERDTLPEGDVRRMAPWRWAGRRLDGLLGFPAFFSPRWYALIANAATEKHADLIMVRDIPLCPTAISVGRRLGIPVVLDMAENYPAMMRALWETERHTPLDYVVRNPRATAYVERRCVRAVDHVIVVVEESAARVRALGVPESRLTIVSNTPPRARITQMPARRSHDGARIDIAYMGNIEVARGLLEAVDAIAHLKASGCPARLRIIGKGRDESLIRQHAHARGLTGDDVEFLGFIQSHREALEIVAAADVGLLPHRKNESWDTTIPNKLFDYMAAGLPVVTSDAAPCDRIVRETGCGEVFGSGNAVDMAAAIRCVADRERSASMGEAGVRAVLERYNWEHDTEVLLAAVDGSLEHVASRGKYGDTAEVPDAFARAARSVRDGVELEVPPV